MRLLFRSFWVNAAALLFLALPVLSEPPFDEPAVLISRFAAGLRLGDGVSDARKLYPHLKPCPLVRELGGWVIRIELTRSCTQSLPKNVESLWLGFSEPEKKLVEVEVVYSAAYTRKRPAEVLADEEALDYGKPNWTHNKFWWYDGKTILRVFYAEVPQEKDGEKSFAMRTSLQILDPWLFRVPQRAAPPRSGVPAPEN